MVFSMRCQYQEVGKIQQILQVKGHLVPFERQTGSTGPRRMPKFIGPRRSAGRIEQETALAQAGKSKLFPIVLCSL